MKSLFRFLREPQWKRQHGWRRAIWQGMARLGLTGLHPLPLHGRWLDIVRRDMPFAGLDPAFEGYRIVQISDVHYSPVVSKRYLAHALEIVNKAKPDLIVVTGDLVTGGYRFAPRVARLLATMKATDGIICTLGNHDYSMFGKDRATHGQRRVQHLVAHLRRAGLLVLRNQTHAITRGQSTLQIVGLDDDWSDHMDAPRAFEGVDANQPVLCLNHNPANVRTLLEFPWHWMLSGHTHGRAIGKSKWGKKLAGKKRFREFVRGHYAIEGKELYVNKGLSYGQRMKEWCRPEITVFRVTGRAASASSPASRGGL